MAAPWELVVAHVVAPALEQTSRAQREYSTFTAWSASPWWTKIGTFSRPSAMAQELCFSWKKRSIGRQPSPGPPPSVTEW